MGIVLACQTEPHLVRQPEDDVVGVARERVPDAGEPSADLLIDPRLAGFERD